MSETQERRLVEDLSQDPYLEGYRSTGLIYTCPVQGVERVLLDIACLEGVYSCNLQATQGNVWIGRDAVSSKIQASECVSISGRTRGVTIIAEGGVEVGPIDNEFGKTTITVNAEYDIFTARYYYDNLEKAQRDLSRARQNLQEYLGRVLPTAKEASIKRFLNNSNSRQQLKKNLGKKGLMRNVTEIQQREVPYRRAIENYTTAQKFLQSHTFGFGVRIYEEVAEGTLIILNGIKYVSKNWKLSDNQMFIARFVKDSVSAGPTSKRPETEEDTLEARVAELKKHPLIEEIEKMIPK